MADTIMDSHETFLLYRASGEIVGHTVCSDDNAAITAKIESLGYLLVDSPPSGDTHYVLDGQVVERPQNPTQLSGMTLTAVPVGSAITIAGTDYACDDGTADLHFDQPGSYIVTVKCWPMQVATFQVTQT
jgi:hypothetical protein